MQDAYSLYDPAFSAFWPNPKSFIMIGVILYIFSIIFKKGVEIQKENDLTV